MATRFYLSSTATVTVTPDYAAWTRTTEADRRLMSPTKDASAMTDKTHWGNTSPTDSQHCLNRQYVSAPMSAGIRFATGDTIKLQVRCKESGVNDNINRAPICLKVVSEDGTTLRATLKALGHCGPNTTEWPTALTNKQLLDGDTLDTDYDTVAGDRLVLEIGSQVSSAGGSGVTGTQSFGSDNATDLGENESDTSAYNPWFEISRTITFGTKAYKDIATRFKLWATSHKDIATRFKLTVQGYKDVATRFRLSIQGFQDVQTRFKLNAQGFKDIQTRFVLWALGYKDISTRFKLNVQGYKDISTRFKTTVQSYKDITTRFKLWATSFKDIATRYQAINGQIWLLANTANAPSARSPGASGYTQICSQSFYSASEAHRQTRIRDSYRFRSLYAYVAANSVNGDTTVRLRKNGANGNSVVTIGASATGHFEDASNIDSVVATDLVNLYWIVGGSTGTITWPIMSVLCESPSASPTFILSSWDNTSQLHNTTYYRAIGSRAQPSSSESAVQHTFRTETTLTFLYGYIFSNDISAASTIRLRKNEANGNQVLSIPADSTGVFDDTSNSDVISVGQRVCYSIVSGYDVTSTGILVMTLSVRGAADRRPSIAADTSPALVAYNTTRYIIPESNFYNWGTTEYGLKTRRPITSKNLFVNVTANDINAVSTLRSRKNGSNGNLTISITALGTGVFEDYSGNIDILDDDDLYNYQIVAGNESGNLTITQISSSLGKPQHSAYKDIATRFVLSAASTAYKDIATRFKVWVQGYKDISTRFKLWALSYKDISTRFVLTVLAYKDISTRFKLTAQGFKDISTRFVLLVGTVAYKDIATRFTLHVRGYKDIATRFKLYVLGYKDIQTRFKLNALSYKDIQTRFKLTVLAYKDIATRFKLTVGAYKDIATRFKLNARSYKDISTRFKLWVQGYKDIQTRFRLWVQGYKDISTRFKLNAQSYKDIATRFRLMVSAYKDVSTRFKLHVQGYKDISTRFVLITWVLAYKDVSTRFKLHAQGYKDIGTRFVLIQASAQPLITVQLPDRDITVQITERDFIIPIPDRDITLRMETQP